MKCFLQMIVAAGLVLTASSCGFVNRNKDKPSEEPTKTISSISPYRSLSDNEINAKYMVRLLELQALNKEMEAANNRKDFGGVNRKAKEGLVKAYDARNLARNLKDPRQREDRLTGVAKIIEDLNTLVRVSGG